MGKRVFIEQEDGQLKPVALPADLAQRAAIYAELRATFRLSLKEITFLVTTNLSE